MVNITKGFTKLDLPSEEEKDVHDELGEQFIPECSRMSCQIFLNKNMEGIQVEIPRSAFFLFKSDNKVNKKDNSLL